MEQVYNYPFDFKSLKIYVEENIEHFQKQLDFVTDRAWENHSSISAENPMFVDKVIDLMYEWAEENDIPSEDVDDWIVDIDDIMLDMLD